MSRALFLILSAAVSGYGQSAVFTWVRQMGGSSGQAIAGMATDSQGNTYVAGNTTSVDFPVKSAFQPAPGGSGLFRVDGPGGAWQNLSASGLSSVSRLAADPSNPTVIYAAGSPALERSADGGTKWTALGSFDVPVTSLAVDANGVLYVATAGSGIFKSADGGATFTAIDNGIVPDTYGRLYFLRIWVSPSQPGVLFASQNSGVVRSGDGGATWQPVSQFGLGALELSFDPNTPGTIYAANGRTPQKSTDDGLTWTALQPAPLPYYQPLTILVDPKQPGTLYGASYGGLWKSADDGQTWTTQLTQPTGVLAADPATGALYAAVGGGVVMSTDGFQTVVPIGPRGLPGVNSIAVAGSHVFIGAQAGSDVFVAKLDPQGNTVYSTYLGGAASDVAHAMAVDAAGAVYVTGTTGSVDFPVSAGAYARSGSSFLFKLNPDGSLAYSTYFTTNSTPYAIAVDAGGHAYIAGVTYGQLPVTEGAYQATLQGSYPFTMGIGPGPPPVTNAFLTEFDPAGASLVFSTYIGSYTAYANVLALDAAGNAILAGGSTLYRMNAGGTALLKTATVKGTVWALAMDGAGNLYAGGQTDGGFPTTPGAFQTARYAVPALPGTLALSGGSAGFVARLDNDFNVVTSTFLSGEVDDRVLSLAFANNGNVIAGGTTGSKAFPTRGPVQSAFGYGTGFVTVLAPDLSSLVYSTFAGDTRPFIVQSVAPAPDGGALIAGATTQPPFYSSYGSFDPAYPTNAGVQAFVVRVGVAPAMPRIDAVVNAASLLPVALSPGGTFQVRGDGFGDDASLMLNGNPIPVLAHSRTALTAMAPADIQTPGATTVQVFSNGARSNPVLVPVAQTAPGIFSADGSGVGQGYILNADGTPNSPSNPVKEGDAITIFATGVGPMTFDGDYAVLRSPANVYVDGFYANGIAAHLGPVSGLPGNVYRISVYVPRPSDYAGANPNLKGFTMPPLVAVTLEINGAKSQAGLALSVTH